MRCEAELEKLTKYIEGFISGERLEVDVIDARELDALRKQLLKEWLRTVERSGCRILGTRGNTPRDVMELIEAVRNQIDVSKQELARRSGVSRGHIGTLLTSEDPNPTLETTVRLSLGLGFALEVVDAASKKLDDAASDVEAEATRGEEGPQERRWEAGVGASMVSGSVLMLLKQNRNAYLSSGLVGVTAIGLGLCAGSPGLRRGAVVVGAGVLAGTLVVGLVQALRKPRA